MFRLSVPAAAYQDPWQEPLAHRVRQLARGRHRVAYFYERADNSTFRYRVHNMVQVLNASEDDAVSGGYFFLDDLPALQEIVSSADMLVLCRTRYDHRVSHLVSAFRAAGKRVLFDIDDFVFNPDYVHLVVRTLDLDVDNPQVWQDWFAYFSRMGAALKLCDGGITTNEFLAERMREFSGLPVAVVPNFMNAQQLAMSDAVYAQKESLAPGDDGMIHVGYFSGSPSHNRDLAIVLPALEELLQENPRLAVAMAGYIPAGPLERFGKRVVRFPFTDYVNLQRLIGAVEFNLMPLQSNVFTDCKSELKYFEAAAVGSVSIASPSYTYARNIRDGDNGYIARAYEWADTLRRALAQLGGYRAMAACAREDALRRFSWEAQRPAILAALGLEAC